MHYGEYEGEQAGCRQDKILVLGESHHISTDPDITTDKVAGVPASYATATVVKEHLEKRKTHSFLTKIAKAFGFAEDRQDAFWESVYLGNYVDVLCGIGNKVAEKQIADNCIKYNDQLFHFVNEHKISKVFCFSMLVYNSFPALRTDEKSERKTVGAQGNRRVFLRQCQYRAGEEHEGTNVILQQDLVVYGISHPSARCGFSPEMYAEILAGLVK